MMDKHGVGTLELMRYVAGDLNGGERERIERHVRACGVCSEELSVLRTEREHFLKKYPFSLMESRLRRTAAAAGTRPAVRYRFAYAFAVCCVAAVGAVFFFTNTRPADGYRVKGNVGIRILVQNAAGGAEERRGHVYYPGDRIQIMYSTARPCYFMLASFDETGRSTVYYPSSGDSAIAVRPAAGMPLPNSICLDDYIGREMFVAAFSQRPFSAGKVAAKLRESMSRGGLDAIAAARLAGMNLRTIRITKKERQ